MTSMPPGVVKILTNPRCVGARAVPQKLAVGIMDGQNGGFGSVVLTLVVLAEARAGWVRSLSDKRKDMQW